MTIATTQQGANCYAGISNACKAATEGEGLLGPSQEGLNLRETEQQKGGKLSELLCCEMLMAVCLASNVQVLGYVHCQSAGTPWGLAGIPQPAGHQVRKMGGKTVRATAL
jgi:hypothetical protein